MTSAYQAHEEAPAPAPSRFAAAGPSRRSGNTPTQSLVVAILEPLLILGVIAGAGDVGDRLFMGSDEALEGTKERKG